MAKEDFCFTYYDGDAARDKAHMNRLERGAYDDIISAQRKRGHLSLDDIKRVLSKDFENCWASMEWILKKDAEEKFFIEWVDKSIEKSKINAAKNKEKIDAYWKKKKNTNVIPQNNNSINLEEQYKEEPLEDGNGNEDGIEEEIGGVGERDQDEKFLVPVMLQTWKKHKPQYPANSARDFPPLQAIAVFICEAMGLNYQARDGDTDKKILSEWDAMAAKAASDNHYRKLNLISIEKHIQSLYEQTKHATDHNGASKNSNGVKLGTSEARVKTAREW